MRRMYSARSIAFPLLTVLMLLANAGCCWEIASSADDDGSGGGALGNCTDQNACIEQLDGSSSAFQGQCASEGNPWSTGSCPSNGSGPTCLGANLTAQGSPYTGNIYWHSTFCTDSPGIDTRGTCLGLGGTPTGTHCSPP